MPRGLTAGQRKPSALKVIQGTARPDRVPANEPRPAPLAPAMPRGLEPAARRAWRRLSPVLERVGLLTVADGEQFSALCRAWARYLEADRLLREAWTIEAAARAERESWGPVDQAEMAGRLRTAEISVERAEFSFHLLAAEFGLSPAARSRMDVPPPRSSEEDFEDYLALGKRA